MSLSVSKKSCYPSEWEWEYKGLWLVWVRHRWTFKKQCVDHLINSYKQQAGYFATRVNWLTEKNEKWAGDVISVCNITSVVYDDYEPAYCSNKITVSSLHWSDKMHSTEYPSFSVFTLSQAVKFGLKFETLKPNLTA